MNHIAAHESRTHRTQQAHPPSKPVMAPLPEPVQPRHPGAERDAYIQALADARARGVLSIDPLAIADAMLRSPMR